MSLVIQLVDNTRKVLGKLCSEFLGYQLKYETKWVLSNNQTAPKSCWFCLIIVYLYASIELLWKAYRVQFNDSWFVFYDSSWSFHKSNFSRKHISQIMQSEQSTRLGPWDLQISTKLSGNFIASKAHLSTISNIIHFFIKQKFCKHFLRSQK